MYPTEQKTITPIGLYQHDSGIPNLPLHTPYFFQRREYLPSIHKTMDQILIEFFGRVLWININLSDLIPLNPMGQEMSPNERRVFRARRHRGANQ